MGKREERQWHRKEVVDAPVARLRAIFLIEFPYYMIFSWY